jgi:hypothetical protein
MKGLKKTKKLRGGGFKVKTKTAKTASTAQRFNNKKSAGPGGPKVNGPPKPAGPGGPKVKGPQVKGPPTVTSLNFRRMITTGNSPNKIVFSPKLSDLKEHYKISSKSGNILPDTQKRNNLVAEIKRESLRSFFPNGKIPQRSRNSNSVYKPGTSDA